MKSHAISKNRHFVTVMFVDICGSTQMYGHMDDEDVASTLHDIISECQAIIQSCGGILNQTLGDGIYAVFGISKSDEFQGVSACIASEKMHQICTGQVALRIGIHSGYVTSTTGEAFSDLAIHLIGKSVNVAAHICSSANARETLLSTDTYEIVKNYTLCNATNLKVKSYAHPLYQLSRTLHYGNKFIYFKDFLSKEEPMIGRDKEFAQIIKNIENAFDQKSRHIHLHGEAGIGKTRMIYSVLNEISHKYDNLRILSCLPLPHTHDGAETLNLLIFELMSHLSHYTISNENIVRILRSLSLNKKVFKDIMLETYGISNSSIYTPSEKAYIKSELILQLLTRLSENTKVIFVIDDVHRIAGDLKTLFYSLQSRTEQGHFFLLTASKQAAFSKTMPEADVINLHSLPIADITGIITSHCPDRAVLQLTDSDIFNKSNGNPYFATQITKFLRNASKVGQSTANQFQLSENIDSLFAFQIGNLEENISETLTCAALIGKEFDLNDLQKVLNVDNDIIAEHLAHLSAIDLIRPYGPLSKKHEFNHEIALYAIRRSLTRAKAQSMHLRILNALRKRKITLSGTRSQQMAHHAFHGGLYPIAYACGLISGIQKLKQSLAGSAEKDFDISFDALCKLAITLNHKRHKSRLQFLRAKSYSLNGYPTKSLQVMTDIDAEIYSHPENHPNPHHQELWASLKWITSNYTREDILKFERYADLSTPLGMSTALRCAGMLTDRGYFDESTQRLLKILGAFDFDNPRANYGLLFPAESSCYSLISKNYAELKNFFFADQYAERALESIADWEYTHQKIFVLTFSSFSNLYSKKYEAALSLLDEANTLTKKFDIDLIAPLVYATHAYADYFSNKNTKSISTIVNVLENMEQRGIHLRRSKYHLYLAKIFKDLGETPAMHDHCIAAHELANKLQEPHIKIQASLLLADLYSDLNSTITPIASPQTLLYQAQQCASKHQLKALLPLEDAASEYAVTN